MWFTFKVISLLTSFIAFIGFISTCLTFRSGRNVWQVNLVVEFVSKWVICKIKGELRTSILMQKWRERTPAFASDQDFERIWDSSKFTTRSYWMGNGYLLTITQPIEDFKFVNVFIKWLLLYKVTGSHCCESPGRHEGR